MRYKNMRQTITVSLPEEIRSKLDRLAKKERATRSDIVREALRQYFIRDKYQNLREKLVIEGQKRGLFTDEDVFREVS